MTKWIMFYSYKGGTGRTSALLNTAALLAQVDAKVGVVDLDFDAPGIASLFGIDTASHDILQLIVERAPVADLEAHVSEVDLNDGVNLLCLPCSGDTELNDKIRWEDVTSTAYLRDALKAFCAIYDLDYVLLDTRSGISHTAAFAVAQANHAVLVCRLDTQNRLGLSRLRAICRERGLPYTIVANCVPVQSCELPGSLNLFQEVVGQAPDVLIPYDPKLYFREEIVAHRTRTRRSKLVAAYRSLVEKMRSAE